MNKLSKKVVAGVLALVLTSSAHAGWGCRAESQAGWGNGYAYSKWNAQRIALHQCSLNTPNYMTCWIVDCWWY